MSIPRLVLAGLVCLASPTTAQIQRSPAATSFPEFGVVPREGGFRMDGYWVWDGSVIKGDDGRYHLFASRWPKTLPFHPGWMTNSEVVRAVADKPEGPYQFQEVVLKARGAEYWDGRATHNPTIRKHGDTYLLYYIGSTHPFADPGKDLTLDAPHTIVARSNKRIGLATAKSLSGPWTRRDQPILDVAPNTFYSFLTSNPSPVVHEDGSVLLVFKSRRYDGVKHSAMMLGVARAPHWRGPYGVEGTEPIFSATRFGEVEDPFVWKTSDGYAMIAKDMTGKLVGERHAAVYATSRDGLTWKLGATPKAYSRTVRFSDGTTQTLGQLERPYVLFEDGRPTFLFGAAGDGPGGFANMTTSFNLAIPLQSAAGSRIGVRK